MKGGLYKLTKAEAKTFLRICKQCDFIKFNTYLKNNNINSSAVYKFINYDKYDDFISLEKLQVLCDEIYNSSGFINDMYKEIILNQKIA